jgi:glycosyltransferase involved in cell wall biosynthesis
MAPEPERGLGADGRPGLSRVVVNGRFLAQPLSGVQRYAREILLALDGLHTSDPAAIDGLQFEVVAPPDARRDLCLRHIQTKQVGSVTGNLWEQLVLPRHASGALLLNLGNAAPLLTPRQAVTLLDAAPWSVPEAYSWRFRAWYRALLPRIAARAEVVLTISESAALDLQRFVLPAGCRPIVTWAGCEHVLRAPADRSILQRSGLAGRRFVICIGNRHAAKNVGVVDDALRRCALPDAVLVRVGGVTSRVFGQGERLQHGERVVEMERVSDPELRALLEAAAVLVSPSRYEGFGLPPLEAMACGCPVIASGIPAHREILGDAALFFDADDAGTLADQLRRVLDDPVLPAALQERGRMRAAGFRWIDAAHRVVRALRGTGAEWTADAACRANASGS